MKSRFLFKPIALLLVFAVMQVYVLLTPTYANTSSDSNANTSSSSLMFGNLLLNGDQSVYVNGASAKSGTTIFSGAQLQTPEGVAATVQLSKLGRLAIDSNTQLTVTFDKDFVDVQVLSGNAELTTNAGVTGTLTTPAGEKLAANPASKSVVGNRAAAAAKAGDHVLGFVITAFVVGVAAVVLFTDDDNESPSSP
jgi:hypothetical protein